MIEPVVIGNAILYCGDCLEILPVIKENTVDMIWTDPPYGHSNHEGDFNSSLNKLRKIQNRPIANDGAESMRVVLDSMLREAARILKTDCCCCCCCCCGGGGPKPTFAWVADRLDRDGFSFFHSVIWDKINPGLGWRYRRQHEMIMVAHKMGGTLAWNDSYPAVSNVMRYSKPRDDTHPNVKPVELVQKFIAQHCPASGIVVDPFMGSGTTGVAAVKMGMKFIGIELDPDFFNVACKRIEDAQKQIDIFA